MNHVDSSNHNDRFNGSQWLYCCPRMVFVSEHVQFTVTRYTEGRSTPVQAVSLV